MPQQLAAVAIMLRKIQQDDGTVTYESEVTQVITQPMTVTTNADAGVAVNAALTKVGL